MYNPDNPVELYLARFLFISLLQDEIDRFVEYWNNHRIRRSSHRTIAGRPNVIYDLPHRYNGTNCLKPVDNTELNMMRQFIENNNTSEFIPPQYHQAIANARNQTRLRVTNDRWADAFHNFTAILAML